MKVARIAILTVWFLTFSAGSFAGIWQDNFDDGNADGWDEFSGDWEIVDGAYQQTTMAAEYQKSLIESDDMTDYVLEVDVTVFEGGPDSTSMAAGVLLRADDTASSGYRIWIRPDQSGFQFSLWQDNQYTHLVVDTAEQAVFGETYHLKVQIEGYTLSVWVDDEVMVDEYDEGTKAFASGRVALINYNVHCQYDNLTISGENIVSNLAVAPSGKLTVTWGALK